MSVTQRIFATNSDITPSTAADPIESLRGTFDQWARENVEEEVVVVEVTKDVACPRRDGMRQSRQMECLTSLEKPEKKGFRPDLDFDHQKRRYQFDKERARLKYLNDIACETDKSDKFSRVAVKGILDEAFRLYAGRHKDEAT